MLCPWLQMALTDALPSVVCFLGCNVSPVCRAWHLELRRSMGMLRHAALQWAGEATVAEIGEVGATNVDRTTVALMLAGRVPQGSFRKLREAQELGEFS